MFAYIHAEGFVSECKGRFDAITLIVAIKRLSARDIHLMGPVGFAWPALVLFSVLLAGRVHCTLCLLVAFPINIPFKCNCIFSVCLWH